MTSSLIDANKKCTLKLIGRYRIFQHAHSCMLGLTLSLSLELMSWRKGYEEKKTIRMCKKLSGNLDNNLSYLSYFLKGHRTLKRTNEKREQTSIALVNQPHIQPASLSLFFICILGIQQKTSKLF